MGQRRGLLCCLAGCVVCIMRHGLGSRELLQAVHSSASKLASAWSRELGQTSGQAAGEAVSKTCLSLAFSQKPHVGAQLVPENRLPCAGWYCQEKHQTVAFLVRSRMKHIPTWESPETEAVWSSWVPSRAMSPCSREISSDCSSTCREVIECFPW